jgi:hypothetical protein
MRDNTLFSRRNPPARTVAKTAALWAAAAAAQMWVKVVVQGYNCVSVQI